MMNRFGAARKEAGFTIVELFIVILLIGVIFFTLLPFVKDVREKARQNECVRHLQEISIALRSYAVDNNNKLPDRLGEIFKKGYLKDEWSLDCPFSAHKGIADDPDYLYEKSSDFWTQENKPIVYDKYKHRPDDKVNILYSNGEINEKARSL